jgi:3-isopropylmalate/(R)-2-methylmalate dehydratase small subunit
MDYGFRAIIAPSFADIFANNCLKNGLLPVILDESQVEKLVARAQEIDGYQLTVDLDHRTVEDAHGFSAAFAIDDFHRYCLLEGLDDIALTLQHEAEIGAYEERRPRWLASTSSR